MPTFNFLTSCWQNPKLGELVFVVQSICAYVYKATVRSDGGIFKIYQLSN